MFVFSNVLFLVLAKWWNISADSDTLAFKFYLFLTVLGPYCCVRAFSSCGERGLLSRCGAWASHCGAQALESTGSSSFSKWVLQLWRMAQLPRGMWELPGSGTEPRSLHWRADSQPLEPQENPDSFTFNPALLSMLTKWCHRVFAIKSFIIKDQ